jgi:hypothetical protein
MIFNQRELFVLAIACVLIILSMVIPGNKGK